MYKNIGGKIKGLAYGMFIAETISAIITGIGLMASDDDWIAIGVLVMLAGPIVAFVFSWFIYAFGVLVENSEINKEMISKATTRYLKLSQAEADELVAKAIAKKEQAAKEKKQAAKEKEQAAKEKAYTYQGNTQPNPQNKTSLQPPSNIWVTDCKSSSALFSWSAVPCAAGYNLYLNGEKINSNPITIASCEITDLSSNTMYEISVTSVDTGKRESKFAHPLKFNTKKN